MKRRNRILSTLLAVIMMLGMFSGLGIEISAATTDEEVEKVAIEDYIKHCLPRRHILLKTAASRNNVLHAVSIVIL